MNITLKQMFFIVDKQHRLMTNMDDVYAILEFINNKPVQSVNIPEILIKIRLLAPSWYICALKEYNEVAEIVGFDFKSMDIYISREKNNSVFFIEQLSVGNNLN
nr:hypothetical protein [uncultured Pedobacter sp.]